MEPVTRTVDTDSYMRVLSGLVAKGETVCLTITGGSMTPFLVHGRDSIRFAKPSGPLRRGDMAFYRRRNGQYVMHRIVRVDRQGNYYAAGDAQTEIKKGNLWWDFFAGPWVALIKLRPLMLKLSFIVPKGLR